MRESTVVRKVKGWLEREYPKRRGFIVEQRKQQYPGFIPDFTVKKRDDPVLQVECKGTKNSMWGALGQCMCYLHANKVETYLAIPSDFIGASTGVGWKGWKEVYEILDINNSPIGLIVVYPEQVRKKRKASR